MRPRSISIVVPVYNGELLIGRCLESVLKQSGGGDLEILVVDDGSTDGTTAVVEDFADSHIRVISQPNQGPAAARNRGISEAQGKYIAFLDADDYWKPGFMEQTLRFLDHYTDAIAVSVGQIHKSIGKPASTVPRILRNERPSLQPQVLDSFYAFWAQHNHVCTGSVLMRTEVARQTGGQRTEFRICEDLEFWAYLATFGRWGFIPEVLFVSDGGTVTREEGWLEKNRRRWASAPTIEQWQERIVNRIESRDVDSFEAARARVAKNLAYSMILSHRDALARQTIPYCDGYPSDRTGILLRAASRCGRLTWKLACQAVRLQEYTRDRWLRVESIYKCQLRGRSVCQFCHR